MKHLKHLCHSNKKSYLSCWQNQTMKKRILQLTGARREYLYTHIKSHWKTPLTPTQFPESHQAQTFPIGSLKVSFHTETFVNTEETLSDAQFTLISTVITWVPSRSFHSHSLVCLPRFPAGSCLFQEIQLKNKKQKTKFISIILIWLTEQDIG